MKKIATTTLLLTMLLTAGSASAQEAGVSAASSPLKSAGNFGIGLGSGTNAAPLSMKYFTSSRTSIQANVGWWRAPLLCNDGYRDAYDDCGFYRDALGLSADFLFEGGPLVGNQDVSLGWEVGAGAGVGVGGDAVGVAAAFVTGLQLNIHALPLDVVAEYRPNVAIVPDVGVNLVDFTGHVRYYF